MSIMFSQTTRLELTIVAAVLLVLFLCRQPPKSGNAGVRMDTGLTPQKPVRKIEDGQRNAENGDAANLPSAIRHPPSPDSQPPTASPSSDNLTSDNNTMELTVPPRPKMKRIGMVDARKCEGLNYKDVMYGEVTVRWVWNGQKFVPRKVLEVRESSGAISTWDFDERDDIVLSEIPQEAQ